MADLPGLGGLLTDRDYAKSLAEIKTLITQGFAQMALNLAPITQHITALIEENATLNATIATQAAQIANLNTQVATAEATDQTALDTLDAQVVAALPPAPVA